MRAELFEGGRFEPPVAHSREVARGIHVRPRVPRNRISAGDMYRTIEAEFSPPQPLPSSARQRRRAIQAAEREQKRAVRMRSKAVLLLDARA